MSQFMEKQKTKQTKIHKNPKMKHNAKQFFFKCGKTCMFDVQVIKCKC